jgi:hypothetical protein
VKKRYLFIAVAPLLLSAHPFHVDFHHIESKGVGYKDGYSTLQGFGIYENNSAFMPFLDLRGHVFNDGKLSGNVGLGARTDLTSINHLLGLYSYYDVRRADPDFTVNQVSLGVELLGKRMEYRLNGYFPVGRHKSREYGLRFATFRGHEILLREKRKYVMRGGDAEVGVHVTQSCRHAIYAGIGPYYFTAEPFSTWGGKARVLWRYQEYLALEAAYSYDHLFKNIFQGTISLSYPFGTSKSVEKRCPNSIAFAPYRFEIPVVKSHTRHFSAINPGTKQPWTVWFVDNTSHSAGTYESPFATLAEAQNASSPSDMIYVFPGDGTTKGMDQGVVLKDNQALVGAGVIQTIKTKKGDVRIPALSIGAPLITSRADVIKLAHGNEVSGLNIVVSDDFLGMIGKEIDGANIHDNVIKNLSGGFGIEIFGIGQLLIKDNEIIGPKGKPLTVGVAIALVGASHKKIEVINNKISGYDYSLTLQAYPVTEAAISHSCFISGNHLAHFYGAPMHLVNNSPKATYMLVNNHIVDTLSLGTISKEGFTAGRIGWYYIQNNRVATYK